MSEPVAELDRQFSSPDATPTPWAAARSQLDAAKTYWLSTVRPDGRPHVTTIAGVWTDDAVHFVTGPSERKALNMAAGNHHVVVTTGCNGWEGLDVVVEGEAVRVTDPDRLARLDPGKTSGVVKRAALFTKLGGHCPARILGEVAVARDTNPDN